MARNGDLHAHRRVLPPAEPVRAAQHLALTDAEVEVLQLLAAGLTAQAIAHVRRTSPRTVGKHLEHIYAKLGTHDRLLTVTRARDLLLLTPTVATTNDARGDQLPPTDVVNTDPARR